MNRIERVTHYENLMREAEEKLAVFETALAEFARAQKSLKKLDSYLRSKESRKIL